MTLVLDARFHIFADVLRKGDRASHYRYVRCRETMVVQERGSEDALPALTYGTGARAKSYVAVDGRLMEPTGLASGPGVREALRTGAADGSLFSSEPVSSESVLEESDVSRHEADREAARKRLVDGWVLAGDDAFRPVDKVPALHFAIAVDGRDVVATGRLSDQAPRGLGTGEEETFSLASDDFVLAGLRAMFPGKDVRITLPEYVLCAPEALANMAELDSLAKGARPLLEAMRVNLAFMPEAHMVAYARLRDASSNHDEIPETDAGRLLSAAIRSALDAFAPTRKARAEAESRLRRWDAYEAHLEARLDARANAEEEETAALAGMAP